KAEARGVGSELLGLGWWQLEGKLHVEYSNASDARLSRRWTRRHGGRSRALRGAGHRHTLAALIKHHGQDDVVERNRIQGRLEGQARHLAQHRTAGRPDARAASRRDLPSLRPVR